MGNNALFSEDETIFCFITNSNGKILHSAYIEQKWIEKEKEIQNYIKKYFLNKLKVKKIFSAFHSFFFFRSKTFVVRKENTKEITQ